MTNINSSSRPTMSNSYSMTLLPPNRLQYLRILRRRRHSARGAIGSISGTTSTERLSRRRIQPAGRQRHAQLLQDSLPPTIEPSTKRRVHLAPAYGTQDGTERYDYGRDATNALARPAMMTASPRMSQHGQHARMSSGLVRTSHLSASAQQLGMGYSGSWGVQKAQLHIRGGTAALDSMMTDRWTSEEWTNQRRIVLFTKRHNGPNLHIDFRPVSVSERPSNSICISCIYWARGPNERGECYVTSVDTIYLLERLIEPLATMGNLASRRRTASGATWKGSSPSQNIEKDVKVFPWKVLGPALKKIVSKYSFDATGTSCSPAIPPPQSAPVSHLLTPVSLPAVSYSGLSTTPISATTATDPSLRLATVRHLRKILSCHASMLPDSIGSRQVRLTVDRGSVLMFMVMLLLT
ncbi:hypothetical protein MCOR02_006702 [Pyricularia oryzae]|nr:hypothetical protein MCOR02_006702 [Pyricularia oryzae]